MSGGGPPTSRYAYEEELNLGISPPLRDPFDVASSDDDDESYDSDEYNITNGDNTINNNLDYEYGESNNGNNHHHRQKNNNKKKKKKKKKKSGRASRIELWKDDTRQFNKNGQNFEMVPLSSDSNHDNDNENNNEEDYFTYDSDNNDDDDDINDHHHHQGVRPSHYSNFYSLSTTDSSSSSSSSLQQFGICSTGDDYETSNSYLPKRLYHYLYPPNIPREVQLLRLDNIAVPACYLLVGLLQGLSGPFTNVYPLDLNASEAQQTTISSLKSLPSTCKFNQKKKSSFIILFGVYLTNISNIHHFSLKSN
jgi:hypothetical protein